MIQLRKIFFFSDNKNMKCVYVCAFVQERERGGFSSSAAVR